MKAELARRSRYSTSKRCMTWSANPAANARSSPRCAEVSAGRLVASASSTPPISATRRIPSPSCASSAAPAEPIAAASPASIATTTASISGGSATTAVTACASASISASAATSSAGARSPISASMTSTRSVANRSSSGRTIVASSWPMVSSVPGAVMAPTPPTPPTPPRATSTLGCLSQTAILHTAVKHGHRSQRVCTEDCQGGDICPGTPRLNFPIIVLLDMPLSR
jgi:hypothetical protein